MNINTGVIYNSEDEARRAGTTDDELVTGTRQALETLRKRLQFDKPGKGPFKPLPVRKVNDDFEG